MFRTEPFGSPGVYVRPAEPEPILNSERLDVCAFVGIAPRGPCRLPRLPEWWRVEQGSFMPQWQSETIPTRRSIAVAVESFDEYRRLYVGFEGPGRLPYAVAAYFENGGKRAYIVRVVHEYGDFNLNQAGIASGKIDQVTLSNGAEMKLLARNEGAWGNNLRAAIGFTVAPLVFEAADLHGLVLGRRQWVPVGTLLRFQRAGAGPLLRFVSDSREAVINGARRRRIDFSPALPDIPTAVEVVEGEMLIEDGALINERHTGLGLSAAHPRWLANELCYRSELIYPDSIWDGVEIEPEDAEHLPATAKLPGLNPPQFSEGEDRFQDLDHEDFFDKDWSQASMEPGAGVHSIAHNQEVASLAVPDLYCPEALADVAEGVDIVSLADATFAPCVDIAPVEETPLVLPEVNQLCLDPGLPGDRKKIIQLQQRVVDFADTQAAWIALLDVPPGIKAHQIMAWRGEFNSSYAAAYLPWLLVSRGDDRRDHLVKLNPSAVAAGIIAHRELIHGVHFGPANTLAVTVVAVDEPVSSRDHDQFHPLGLNVYITEPDGIRLSAARTLSNDPAYRQLNVRRLIILLKRVLNRQMRWAVFEPNGPALWRQVSRMLESLLLQLYRAGAFTGATPDQAFFVRCDAKTNTRQMQDAGRLVAKIGVAPAEPMEFIVFRITLEGDSTLVREIANA